MVPWLGGPLEPGEALYRSCPVCGATAAEGPHTAEECSRRVAAKKTPILGILSSAATLTDYFRPAGGPPCQS
jgi:hypothetical protein